MEHVIAYRQPMSRCGLPEALVSITITKKCGVKGSS